MSSSWSIHDPTDLSALYFGDASGGHDTHDTTTTSHRNNNEDNNNNNNNNNNDNNNNNNNAGGDSGGGVIYAGPIQVRQKHDGSGRGLFVTRHVKAGELLLIAQPIATVSVPDVYHRWYNNNDHRRRRRHHSEPRPGHGEEEVLDDDDDKRGGKHSTAAAVVATTTTSIPVSEASEQCLVDTILERQRQNDASLCAALSFLQQQYPPPPTPTGATSTDSAAAADVIVHTDNVPLMTLLLGGDRGKQQQQPHPSSQQEQADDPPQQYVWTVEQVTQIIRRNAFGPDFTTPQSIQAMWQQQQQQQRPDDDDDDNDNDNENNTSSSSSSPPFLPPRLLGLYALPAMINHSCLPNAVRVYVGDTMIVHASRDIDIHDDNGGEVVWSYVPVVQPYRRRRQLQQTHGFCCICDRCVAEEGIMIPLLDDGDNGDNAADIIDDDNALSSSSFLLKKLTVAELEESILPSLPSNELRRYVRVSYLSVYLNEVNNAVVSPDPKRWIPLGMQLHLALAACHNASTEHLSILHFLYELEPEASKRSFWADQLRRAVMVRYGSVGHDIHHVRRLLQHTRTVLRQRHGMQQVCQSGNGVAFI